LNLKKIPLFVFFVPIILILLSVRDNFNETDYFNLSVLVFSIWILSFIIKYKETVKKWLGIKQ